MNLPLSAPTLILICGLPCAGKTTLARKLEEERRAVRLTPDDWISGLLGADPDLRALNAARDPMEALLWNLAERLLKLGVSVILDFGFWSRLEREELRSRARALGARSEVQFLEVPLDELCVRMVERNRIRPAGTFRITEEQLRGWHALFEPPESDELLPRAPDGGPSPGLSR